MNDTEMPTSGVAGAVAGPNTDIDPDAVLVKQYLDGDARAFESLFRKYQAPVFNMVSRMVRGEDAYDVTQDAFCNALRALHTFRGDSRFSTWLFSIARNACLNSIRHSGRVREESLDQIYEDHPSMEHCDGSVDLAASAETHELQQVVNAVLATLRPEQRMMIVLRDFEQLSYEEIGQVMNMSLSNVKSKLHRARLIFRDRCRPYLGLFREDES
jgi:RNA polymerase sigma-70 factor (ECF subfamily)